MYFFSFCMLSGVYVWIVLPVHLFGCHGLLLLVVLGPFSHCAAGFDSCDPDTWILVKFSALITYLLYLWKVYCFV